MSRKRVKSKGKNKKSIKTIKAIMFITLLLITFVIVQNLIKPKVVHNEQIAISNKRIGDMNMENVTMVESMDDIEVPVPKGYKESPDENERYVNGVTTQEEEKDAEGNVTKPKERISGGFVIYEGEDDLTMGNLEAAKKSRNQYVWVPISKTDRANMIRTDINSSKNKGKLWDYSATGRSERNSINKNDSYREPAVLSSYDLDNSYLPLYLEGITRYEFLAEMEEEFEEMVESVGTYGGFYIGRYETGDLAKDVPVIQKGNSDIHSQTWYTMYNKMKKLNGTNDKVEVGMIWGCQWDATLEWLVKSGEKTYAEVGADSTSWGNYSNSTFTYNGSSTKSKGSSTRIPTGSTEYTKANNIYDLAGNVYDWTMEAYSFGHRTLRRR